MTLEQELTELERGFWNATREPGYYEAHMADSGLAVFSDIVLGKAEAAASTSAAQTTSWGGVQLDDVRLLRLSDDVAALVYTGRARRDGTPYAANTTSTYVRRDGQWQLMLHQQSANSDVTG
jgi:Domain of unknown function (DUF4440)